MLCRVDKTIDTLLMEIEGLPLVLKRLKVMHMDESIERGGEDTLEVLDILQLGDPSPMDMVLILLDSNPPLFVLEGLLFLHAIFAV